MLLIGATVAVVGLAVVIGENVGIIEGVAVAAVVVLVVV